MGGAIDFLPMQSFILRITFILFLISLFQGCSSASTNHRTTGVKAAASPAAEADFRNAEALFDAGKLDEAEKAFLSFETRYSDDPLVPSARIFRARILSARGRFEEARGLLSEMINTGSDDGGGRARLYLGESLVGLKRYQDAWDLLLPLAGTFTDESEELTLARLLSESAESLGLKVEALRFLDLRIVLSKEPHEDLLARVRDLVAQSSLSELQKAYTTLDRSRESWGRVAFRLAQEAYNQNDLDRVEAILGDVDQAGRTELPELSDLGDKVRRRRSVDPYTVGCLVPLSGRGKEVGERVLKGLMLAADAFASNQRGTSFSLAIRDTAGDPALAEQGVEELVLEEKAVAIVGPVDSPGADRAAKRAEELGVPLVALSAKPPSKAKGSRYVFNNFPTPADEITMLAQEAVGVKGSKRVSLLVPDSGYGEEVAGKAADEIRKAGGVVTATRRYASGLKSFAEIAAGLASEGEVDAVLVAGSPEDVELALPALASAGLWSLETTTIPKGAHRVALLIPSLAAGSSLYGPVKRYLRGAVLAVGYSSGASPYARAFSERFQAEYESLPDVYNAFAYDTFGLIRKAVEGGARTRAEVRDALAGSKPEHEVTPFNGFDAAGNAVRPVLLLTYTDQGPVPLKP